MAKSKIQIHEFDPTIYPRKLWVVKGYNAISAIKDVFTYKDGNEICFDNDLILSSGAVTMYVKSKKDNKLGVLVWLRCQKDVSTIAHESVHFASSVFNDCNMTMGFDGGKDEHFAYLVGFCADCLHQVAINKFKE